MNFSELKTELAARGFDYLSDTRLGQYINWARAELDDTELWPYREESATGTAPLSISDLGTIEAVIDTTTSLPLEAWDYRDLLHSYGDLSVDGSPQFYYLANPSGTPEVATYPESSNTIGVQYWEVTPDLTGTDTPLAPSRFHKIIVDMAARECYRDADNHQAAEALQVQIDRDLWRMREALLVGSTQGPQARVQITEGWS